MPMRTGLAASDIGELQPVADYMNPAGNMGWAELEQKINGIPVFQGVIRGGFTAKGELARTTGALATVTDALALSTEPGLSAGQAVALAAASVGWNVAERSLTQKAIEQDGRKVTFARGSMANDAVAWQVYFQLAPGVVRLAWATEIWGDPDAFFTVVDAEKGVLLFRKNMTDVPVAVGDLQRLHQRQPGAGLAHAGSARFGLPGTRRWRARWSR